MRWSVTTAPTGTVCTWDQVKHHVRPASLAEQPYIMGDLLASATAYAETMMECCLLPQTLTAIYDVQDVTPNSIPFIDPLSLQSCLTVQLPRGPVISITSLTDVNNSAVTYKRHTAGNAEMLVLTQPVQSTQYPLTVVYQAGFTTIPADILSAIKVHVATIYFNREDISNLATNPVHKIDNFYRFKSRGCPVG